MNHRSGIEASIIGYRGIHPTRYHRVSTRYRFEVSGYLSDELSIPIRGIGSRYQGRFELMRMIVTVSYHGRMGSGHPSTFIGVAIEGSMRQCIKSRSIGVRRSGSSGLYESVFEHRSDAYRGIICIGSRYQVEVSASLN